jgi:hypothetical protein
MFENGHTDPKLIDNIKRIVARMWGLYKTGIGLTTGFIGSQYSYTQLQCIHFTLAVHYSTCRVFSLVSLLFSQLPTLTELTTELYL